MRPPGLRPEAPPTLQHAPQPATQLHSHSHKPAPRGSSQLPSLPALRRRTCLPAPLAGPPLTGWQLPTGCLRRETLGQHPCDARSPTATYRTTFPGVDFTHIVRSPCPALACLPCNPATGPNGHGSAYPAVKHCERLQLAGPSSLFVF